MTAAVVDLELWKIPTDEDQPWRLRAKCRGRPLEDYLIDHLPKGRNAPATRLVIAQARCSGCPVREQCAQDALDRKDMGVIRAGIPLSGSEGSLELRIGTNMLRKIVGLPPTEDAPRKDTWPRKCKHCSSAMRPRGSTEEDYPNTRLAMNREQCGVCWSTRYRENKEKS